MVQTARYQARRGRAEEIYEGTKDLIVMLPKDAMTKLMIRQVVDALNAVSKTLERLKAEMLELASQLPEYLVYMTAGANKFLRIYYGRVKEYLAAQKEPPAPDPREYI